MLTPWKKSYDQPKQYIQKQRHYFANKVHLVKAMVFPIVMYGYESWTIKNTEGGMRERESISVYMEDAHAGKDETEVGPDRV